jgi:hypothetical protein
LRFVDGLKNQLLISHPFLPIQCRPNAGEGKIKSNFGIIPSTFVSALSEAEITANQRRPRQVKYQYYVANPRAKQAQPGWQTPVFGSLHRIRAKLRLRTTRLRLYETPNLGVPQTGSSATIATGSLAKNGISPTFPVDCDIEIPSWKLKVCQMI